MGLTRVITWVVVKTMVPFWVLSIIRHLIFRGPKKGTIFLTTSHIGSMSLWLTRNTDRRSYT